MTANQRVNWNSVPEREKLEPGSTACRAGSYALRRSVAWQSHAAPCLHPAIASSPGPGPRTLRWRVRKCSPGDGFNVQDFACI